MLSHGLRMPRAHMRAGAWPRRGPRTPSPRPPEPRAASMPSSMQVTRLSPLPRVEITAVNGLNSQIARPHRVHWLLDPWRPSSTTYSLAWNVGACASPAHGWLGCVAIHTSVHQSRPGTATADMRAPGCQEVGTAEYDLGESGMEHHVGHCYPGQQGRVPVGGPVERRSAPQYGTGAIRDHIVVDVSVSNRPMGVLPVRPGQQPQSRQRGCDEQGGEHRPATAAAPPCFHAACRSRHAGHVQLRQRGSATGPVIPRACPRFLIACESNGGVRRMCAMNPSSGPGPPVFGAHIVASSQNPFIQRRTQ